MTIAAVLSGEKRFHVEAGDCLAVMRAMPDACIDSIVCDPPAAISFMSNLWDSDGGDPLRWMRWLSKRMREARRVLKPGGYAFVWAIPRTSDLTGMALRLAGFELRDKIVRIFGQGMPHGLNVGLAIDDALGVEHMSVGTRVLTGNAAQTTKEKGGTYGAGTDARGVPPKEVAVKRPGSLEGQRYEGWNTALKPGVEDWWVVQRPIAERTIARQVLATGTGALNVDACRVNYLGETDLAGTRRRNPGRDEGVISAVFEGGSRPQQLVNAAGRYPANLVLSHSLTCTLVGARKVKAAPPWNDNRGPSPFTGPATSPVHHSDGDGTETVEDWKCEENCPVRLLDEQSGERRSAGHTNIGNTAGRKKTATSFAQQPGQNYADAGGASRYFHTFPADPFVYASKASRADRERGLEHLPKNEQGRANAHPTVKSVLLMRHFVRLSCRPGGVVLDCFAGSGTTGVACSAEGMRFIGIDLDETNVKVARARIEGDSPLFNREARA